MTELSAQSTPGAWMPFKKHRIKESHLDLLCHGYGSAELTETLWKSEFSRRLLLLDAVRRLFATRPDPMGPLPPASASIDLLEEVDRVDRATFRQVLMHPQVGSWAAYVVRREKGHVSASAPRWVDAGGLHAVALVAAARRGLDWSTVVPARDGRAMLPGLGMAVFPGAEPWDAVEAEVAAGVLTLRHGAQVLRVPVAGAARADGASVLRVPVAGAPRAGGPEWWELRRLRVGGPPALAVTLDDIDPYRDLGDPVPAQRLPAADAERWTALLAGAWDLIVDRHPPSAEAMAPGIVSLVPLSDRDGAEARSASTGEAFGSVLVSEPGDSLSLAVALIHEFAHIRLGGLLHLLPVTSGGEEEILYAPWRDDPRPLPGLIQGIFAFVNICDFWRMHNAAQPGPGGEFEYALSREQARQALGVAAGSAALTPLGRRLIAGLGERVAGWAPLPEDSEPARVAALIAAGHRAGWRLRHLRPAKETVDRLVIAWARGEQAPPADPGYRVVPGAKTWSQGRLALARRRFERGTTAVTARLRALGVDEADAELLRGENAAAGTSFAHRIRADPDDLDAWTGLGLTVEGPAAAVLGEHPAMVRAVYAGVRGSAPDPVAFATWLGPALL
ncbi:HEXXH motif domain-containing protein [Actinoplanes sp. Pm04-4]|uniref:HEXXH motif domain-containing protein n=1 Tax=Paractinoplanes pyxinae TaxID=2997416 RepID=A0ABT4BCV5_9ACTN|nr:HEXXH motif domain-containing protein [Actinoplanes pyxinae]MCY1144348.1 HEXXH motif domain-containing protein [Actinoplanes pyxinae]